MRYLFVLLLSGLFTMVGFAQNPIEKEGWELTFSDEFNGDQLDRVKWRDSYYWGGRYNNNGVCYYGEDQFQFTDSSLVIVAEKKTLKENYPYASGLIDCSVSFKQKYGYFEIRSKNPKGTGHWPAFWLVTTEQWPPEIDIYEFYTNYPDRISTTLHWLNKRKKKRMQSKKHVKEDASEDFHTYAIEWTKRYIVWYYDNQKIRKTRKGVKSMVWPMHIIINNEVSNTNDMKLEDAIFPAYFEIDYVRAYKRKF